MGNESDQSPGLENITLLNDEMQEELTRILNFWSKEVFDQESKTFVGRIDHHGTKYPEAELGCVLIARILWTFSAAYKTNPKKEYKSVADAAFSLLTERFWDQERGGLYWSLEPSGNVVNSKKQAYAQGFGLYGLSEYYDAFNSVRALDYAHQLYELLEDRFYDPENGGYWEALDANWGIPEDLRLSDKDKNYPKTMNTHLHILEPYTNLFRYDPSEKLKLSLENLVKIFLEKIVNRDTGHFDLFFEVDWTPVYFGASFGHDIEGAWLMREAALLIQNRELLEQVEKASLQLVDLTLKDGTDIDGSLFNEKHGQKLDSDKHWWPQAEAMVGLMDAWEIENKREYLVGMTNVWSFIKTHLIDKDGGEWYWRVDKEGKVVESEDKAGFWKCPYHNSRALMEIKHRMDKNFA